MKLLISQIWERSKPSMPPPIFNLPPRCMLIVVWMLALLPMSFDLSATTLHKTSSIAEVERTITGTVKDADGESLIGVNVVVKGTTIGTSTDIDGNYSLNVPDDASTLVFSYTGFKEQEVNIGSQTVIDVVLGLDAEVLDEVVVVGYGTQRRVDLTGAVGSVTSEDLGKAAALSADQALRGRLSGVQLANRSGDPGSPISVRIRGVGTTGSNQPLWVVDGVPIVQTTNITVNTAANTESNPLVGINPSDIESIDVLKDASAAAIYGARAANGVIIVTTKRGKEGRTSLNYNAYYGVQSARKRLDLLNTDQYIALQDELGRDFSAFAGSPTVDWQDAVFSTASMQSHNLSATGGTEKMNFSVSGGYFKQDGILPALSFERYSVKANSDIKVGDRIKIGESLNISFSDRLVQSEPGRAAALLAARNAPFTPVLDDNGAYTVINTETAGSAAGSTTQIVGLNDLDFNETRVLSRRILGNIYGEIEIIKGLKYKIAAGVDYNVGQGSWFQNRYSFGGNGGNNASRLKVVSKPTELTTNVANTLTYSNSFGPHNLTVLVGHEETNFEFDRLRGQGRGFLNEDVTLVNTAAVSAVGQEADHWALRGYLGRVNYSYDGKYLLTFNIRRDQTSRFAEDNRSDIFPSVSVGWRMSDENFLSGISAIDELKVRAAWGQSGNQFTGTNFAYVSTLGLTSLYVLGDGQTIEAAPTPFVFANPNLRWETSTQIDFGVDLRLWEGRMEFSLDYYQKNTTDILVGLPISAVSGFLLPPDVNSGEVLNNGIEISALYRNSFGDVSYSIGGNLTTVNNEVKSLGQNANAIITGYFGAQTHRTTIGSSIGHFYGYKTDGIYQNQGEVDNALPDDLGTPAPGDIRFVDVNNDGRITPADRTIIGSAIPSAFFGFNLGAEYKGLDVSIFFQGVTGMQVFNNARASLESMNGTNNQLATVANRWTPSNPSNTMPRATTTDPNSNNRFSDRWVEDAGFVRLQNLQIGYSLAPDVLQSIGNGLFSNFRVYLGIQNLFTFTNYSGYDPEVTRGFSFQKGEMPLANGQDDGVTPQPRIFQIGGSVTF
ncbi:MAG: TonB-dependent receptor [Bacteroidota bacterium]